MGLIYSRRFTDHADYRRGPEISAVRQSAALIPQDMMSRGPIETFVYSKSEIQLMFKNFHLTLLEALNDGIVIYDRGGWAKLQEEFALMLDKKVIEHVEYGWRIFEERLEA